ncbi:MAG: ECF transporter S component [Clostridiales bacterium]|nr:ECF transporter S component [Clostridiales bacterium]
MVQLALLTAILLLLAFTPMGYIKLPTGLSITIIGIPVIIGAITLGPAGGAILGAIFGLTSFAQAFGADPFGVILLGINPIGLFITTMVPRILMGWLTGLIFKGLKKIDKTKLLSYVITSLAGSLLNTILFMSTLMLIFYNNPKFQEIEFIKGVNASNVLALVIAMVGINIVTEMIASGILGTAIAKAVDKYSIKNEA